MRQGYLPFLDRLVRARTEEHSNFDPEQVAVAPGESESSTEAQHVKALAHWQALHDAGLPSAAEAAAVEWAIAFITRKLKRIRGVFDEDE